MADSMPPTKYVDYCHVARLLKARKQHRCEIRDHYPYPCRTISPGDLYIRSTIFPGHDAAGSRWDKNARPQSQAVCLNCARNYIGLDTLVPGDA